MNSKVALGMVAVVLMAACIAVVLDDVSADGPTVTFNESNFTKTDDSTSDNVVWTIKATSGYYLTAASFSSSPSTGITINVPSFNPKTDTQSTATVTVAKTSTGSFTVTVTPYKLASITTTTHVYSKNETKTEYAMPNQNYEYTVSDKTGYSIGVVKVNNETVTVPTTKKITIDKAKLTESDNKNGKTVTVDITYNPTLYDYSVSSSSNYDRTVTIKDPEGKDWTGTSGKIGKGCSLIISVTPKNGYEAPTKDQIKVNEKGTGFSYSNGKITISNVSQKTDVTITVSAKKYNIDYLSDREGVIPLVDEAFKSYTYSETTAFKLPTKINNSGLVLIEWQDEDGNPITQIDAKTYGNRTITGIIGDDMSDKSVLLYSLVVGIIGIMSIMMLVLAIVLLRRSA